MKKIFSMIIALVMSSAVMFAQESNRDANGKFQFGPYETNSFLSNWFVEVGAGVQGPVDNLSQIFKGGLTYDFGGLAVNANIGKWFDPCYGVRVGWQGLTTGNIDNKTTFANSFDGTHYFNFVHGDFLVNFSNLVAGYKETRAVDVVPFLSAGAVFKKNARSLGVGAGIQAPIRITNVFKIVPVVSVIATNNRVIGGSGVVLHPSASVMLQVNLGRNNWTRKSTTVAEYTALVAAANAAESAANSRVANLKVENEHLTSRVNDAERRNAELQKQVESAKVVDRSFTDFVVYFDMGKATLSERELAHLDYCAKSIVTTNSKVKFYVSGGADSSTGSVKRNTELSANRAEYVCSLLEDKYGVTNIERVETPVMDLVPTSSLSRVAIISVE